jgi:hypothetical protein
LRKLKKLKLKGGKKMILKKRDNYFSVEKIQKKVVFSERKNGTIMVHMFLREKNAIPLTNDLFTDENITIFKEKSLWVSPQGAFGFRRIGSIGSGGAREIIGIAIEGKFELRLKNNELIPVMDSQYKVIAEKISSSRRYISEEQIREIRKWGDYNVEFESDRYWVIKTVSVHTINFEFRIYKIENLRKILEFLSYDFDSYTLANSIVYFKTKVRKSEVKSEYYHLYEISLDENNENELKNIVFDSHLVPLVIGEKNKIKSVILKNSKETKQGVFANYFGTLLVGTSNSELQEENIMVGIYLSSLPIFKEVEQKKQDSDEYIPV